MRALRGHFYRGQWEGGEMDQRWQRRRVFGAALGAVVVLGPVVVSLLVAVACSHLVGSPRTLPGFVAAWGTVLAAASVAMLVTERQVRRLLPLRALLDLTLVFPDRAPSRFRLALRSGSVGRLRDAAEAGLDAEPAAAAATILGLAGALNAHDPRTRGHSERVRALTDMLAEELRLDAVAVDRLRWAALLHDVGKVAVPADVLNKTEDLTAEDWAAIQRHPEEGARLAAPLKPWLGDWADSIEQHHEHWDGSGYPKGLAGADIAYGSRIVSVADAFEVMTHPRSYRQAIPATEARAELARCAGTHFDPNIVRAFLRISVSRLRWLIGPLAWAADFGLVGAVTRLQVPAPMRGVGRRAATLTTAGAFALPLVAASLAPTAVSDGPRRPPTEVLGEVFERDRISNALAVEIPPVPTTTTPIAARPRPAPEPVPTTVPRAVPPPTAPGPPEPTPTWGAVADSTSTSARKPVRIDVLANDVGAFDPRTLRIVDDGPPVAKANVTKGGEVLFVPSPSGGADSFVYEVCEPGGRCSTAEVTVTLE